MTFKGEPLEIVNEISKKTFYIAILPFASSLVMGEFTSAVGILYGLVISILLFRLKYIHINKALDMDMAKATRYIRNRYYINYTIYFIVLLTAYLSPKLNFLAAVLGLLLLKFVIIGLAVIDLVQEKWRKKLDTFKEGSVLE